jgi:hypothetical protein
MKLTQSILGLGLIATSIAQPVDTRDPFQTVHLTFHGGPAEYSIAIPADGQVYPTSEFSRSVELCVT